MAKPLSHSGFSMSQMIRGGINVVGHLVYRAGDPQRIGIVRDFEPDPMGYWNSRVLVEWQTGKKVWRHAGSILSVNNKLDEERRVIRTIEDAREEAWKHFKVGKYA